MLSVESSHIEDINAAVHYLKSVFKNAEGGHDWYHTERVWFNAKRIASVEDVNIEVVDFAALFHDVADPKFHHGDESIGIALTKKFLLGRKVDLVRIDHVLNIIRHMSFKNSFDQLTFNSLEMQVVQDADRLDAIGAIGIARAFNYGGFVNAPIFDPHIWPVDFEDKQSYTKEVGPSINHFFEKLLKLRDLMNTETGKNMAQERHDFLKLYLSQFFKETGQGEWLAMLNKH